jgi:hypothetical protein
MFTLEIKVLANLLNSYFKILKFFDADRGYGKGKNVGSGINIPDPQHWQR